ncbi:MAG: hypothetical protein AAB870_02600 [Patescibacteria group bacterium]
MVKVLAMFSMLALIGAGCITSSPQETINTKTHTSEQYSVSFEYPENWIVYEDAAQLDIQPPQGQPSNYFTLDTEGEFSPYKTLEELVSAKNLTKADLTIDGQDVYTNDTASLSDSEMLYFYFSHDNKIYNLHLLKGSFEMPEVQAMVDSVDLNSFAR